MAWKGLRSFIHQREHPAQPSFPNLDIIQYEIMGVTLETVKKPPFLGQPGQGRAKGQACRKEAARGKRVADKGERVFYGTALPYNNGALRRPTENEQRTRGGNNREHFHY